MARAPGRRSRDQRRDVRLPRRTGSAGPTTSARGTVRAPVEAAAEQIDIAAFLATLH
jgi:hypothetical protein